jgi:hypothetical protein
MPPNRVAMNAELLREFIEAHPSRAQRLNPNALWMMADGTADARPEDVALLPRRLGVWLAVLEKTQRFLLVHVSTSCPVRGAKFRRALP